MGDKTFSMNLKLELFPVDMPVCTVKILKNFSSHFKNSIYFWDAFHNSESIWGWFQAEIFRDMYLFSDG